MFHYSVEFAESQGQGCQSRRRPAVLGRATVAFSPMTGERLPDRHRADGLPAHRAGLDREPPASPRSPAWPTWIPAWRLSSSSTWSNRTRPKLGAYGVSYTDLADALQKANLSVGADFIQRAARPIWCAPTRGCAPADEIGPAPWSPARAAFQWLVRDLATVTRRRRAFAAARASRDG